MSKIHEISNKFSQKILDTADIQDNYKTTVTKYAVERVMNLSLFTIVLIITMITVNIFTINITVPTLVLLLVFILVRSNFGGLHLKKDWQCLIFSVALPILGGILSYYIQFNIVIIILLYVFSLISIKVNGVVDNENKRLSENKKKKFLIRGRVILIVIIVVHVLLCVWDQKLITNAIGIGVFLGFANLFFGK